MLVIGCKDQPREQAIGTDQTKARPPAQATQPSPAQPSPAQPATQPAAVGQGMPGWSFSQGNLVSCRPGAELEETAARLVDQADANGDGKVSKDETQALTNFVVGGFFFRADTNGDGVVTPEEGKQARKELESRYPALASLFRSVRSATGQSPFATLARLLDVQYDKPLAMAEARDAARAAVNDLYALADADRDGVITLGEARSVAWQGAQALGQTAFQAADTDRNKSLSLQEFQAALQAAAKTVFTMADGNSDGQLTDDEAASAMSRIAGVLAVPAPTTK